MPERRRRLLRADRLEALLFSTGSTVFALLDAARDPGVVPLLERGDCPYGCLYKGQAAAIYRNCAPYLVRLSADADVTDRLLSDGWGTNAGLFLGTSLAAEALCEHLRHFLYVTLPNGKRACFRFYDPRVMRSFLPTCTGVQLDDFLREAIDWVVVEGPDPDTAQVYSRVHGAGDHEPRLVFDNVGVAMSA